MASIDIIDETSLSHIFRWVFTILCNEAGEGMLLERDMGTPWWVAKHTVELRAVCKFWKKSFDKSTHATCKNNDHCKNPKLHTIDCYTPNMLTLLNKESNNGITPVFPRHIVIIRIHNYPTHPHPSKINTTYKFFCWATRECKWLYEMTIGGGYMKRIIFSNNSNKSNNDDKSNNGNLITNMRTNAPPPNHKSEPTSAQINSNYIQSCIDMSWVALRDKSLVRKFYKEWRMHFTKHYRKYEWQQSLFVKDGSRSIADITLSPNIPEMCMAEFFNNAFRLDLYGIRSVFPAGVLNNIQLPATQEKTDEWAQIAIELLNNSSSTIMKKIKSIYAEWDRKKQKIMDAHHKRFRNMKKEWNDDPYAPELEKKASCVSKTKTISYIDVLQIVEDPPTDNSDQNNSDGSPSELSNSDGDNSDYGSDGDYEEGVLYDQGH